MKDHTSIRISREQLERLRLAPRSPRIWDEIGVHLPDAVIVVVEQDRVRLVRKCAA
jgi:hypothetical protein